ncbi:MAG: hypothetical protein EKK37_06625 [Sphingobacteriales bacterium]|nr:MAG: hypothetical protein EKK37_06625 [Sphingobacteriales bacterium]
MFKRDNLKLGIVLGILAPVLGFFIYYFVKFYPLYSLSDFLSFLKANKSLITVVVSLSLLANAALFTLYINWQKDLTAKGIFVVTVIYGIAALLFRLLVH